MKIPIEVVKRIQLGLCPDNRQYDCKVCTYSECWTKTLSALITEEQKPLVEALEGCQNAFTSWQIGQIPGRPEDILALICKVNTALKGVER